MKSWPLSRICWRATVLLLVVPSAALVHAASLESLVMPGPVTAAHAELEETCSNCHDPFDRDSQNTLCLDCHESVAEDVAGQTGFHGRHPDALKAECSLCHGEHLGRDADITGLLVDVFDHAHTDFPLTGSHQTESCFACHDSDAADYRLAETGCSSCHEADDVHGGGLGQACADCHETDNWLSGRFDHSTTAFPLVGQHEDVRCAGCHSDNSFEDTASECVDCHSRDDVHDGSRGNLCSDCHTPDSWIAEFDHLASSGFALSGKHADLACASCHLTAPADSSATLPEDCAGCHRSDDVHLGRNGSACEDCHSQSTWKTEFEHFEVTGFRLEGSHQNLICSNCHVGTLTDPLANDCWGCHEADDPHDAMLLECDDCHGQKSFSENLTFNHDLAGFALVGLHRTVACAQCHDSLVFSPLDSGCADCHVDKDTHEGSLGNVCGDCHNPVGWDFVEFDHAATGFDLTGAHSDLTCESCHGAEHENRIVSANCSSCHRADDVHRGEFGPRCDRCHGEVSFSELEMGRRP